MDKDNVFHKYRYHNPYWRAGSNYNSYRSYLFATYDRKVPGGFAKIVTGAMWFSLFYGAYRFSGWKGERDRMKSASWEYKRKSTPFMQAIADRQFLAGQAREQWIRAELFKGREEELLALEQTYSDATIFDTGKSQGYLHFQGHQRSYKSKPRSLLDATTGFDPYRQNIPTDHY